MFDDVSPDDGIVRAEFYESDYGPDFGYYVVEGGGHAVPGSTSDAIDVLGYGPTNRDIVTADEIWAFFADRPAVPVPYVTGDFNGDGYVNAVDYTVWRDGNGATPLPNDYHAWLSRYGTDNSLLLASIPEPATAGLVLLASLWGLVRR
ncbi:MAG: hypothetical protein AAF266_14165 [Planctomycetota bacterium]